MSQLAGWSPIKDGPPLFIKSEREGYCQVRAELYMFEYYSAPKVQMCLDKLIDQLGLSHDCYEIALEPKKKQGKEEEEEMSIYAYKGVNGW